MRLLLLLLALATGFAPAASASDPETPAPATEAPPAADAPAAASEEPGTSTAAEVDRIDRIQSALESDREKLAALRTDRAKRLATFEELTETRKGNDRELALLREKLEGLAEGASEQRAEFEARAAQLEAESASLAERSELALKAERTVGEQVQALESKVAKDEEALNQLKGIAEPTTADAGATPPAAEPPAAATPTRIPGVPIPLPQAAAPNAPQPEKPAASETAEQIQARLEVERKQQAARRAEKAIEDFVQRKQALQHQIELEERLLETAEKTIDSLERAEAEREREIDELLASGADRVRLREAQDTLRNARRELDAVREEIDDRQDELIDLRERLAGAQADQIRFTEDVQRRRKEAEEAQRRSSWLQSPFHPRNVGLWVVERGPRILGVLVTVLLLIFLVRVGARHIARLGARRRGAERELRRNRADTLALSFSSAANVLLVVFGVLVALQEAGLDVRTVLGGAAILGVAIAFGAQNLMRDYFNGFMILIEDQYELGDLLTIDGTTGTVEKVNMRTTVLRDIEGRVHFIPNGEIRRITNRTYEWARALLTVPIGLGEDADRAMDVLNDVAAEFAADPEWSDTVMEAPVMLGVDSFNESGAVIKFMLKTQPDQVFPVRREMLRRVKRRFDELGIQIGVPHRLVNESERPASGRASEGSSPSRLGVVRSGRRDASGSRAEIDED